MDSEVETKEQEHQPKDPLRHFLPLDVPSVRSESVSAQRSVAVSLKSELPPRSVSIRPGVFLNERQCLPVHLQAQMASGPEADYGHLVFRAWEVDYGSVESVAEAQTQPDISLH